MEATSVTELAPLWVLLLAVAEFLQFRLLLPMASELVSAQRLAVLPAMETVRLLASE